MGNGTAAFNGAQGRGLLRRSVSRGVPRSDTRMVWKATRTRRPWTANIAGGRDPDQGSNAEKEGGVGTPRPWQRDNPHPWAVL